MKLLTLPCLCLLLAVSHIALCGENLFSDFASGEACFCQLKGQVDDCSCNIDTVDYYNNAKIYPRLASLLPKDYFRFFRVNQKRACPFWQDDSKCSSEDCSVKTCDERNVPQGLKPSLKYTKEANRLEGEEEPCAEKDNELGHLNKTISMESVEGFERWRLHDDAQDNFCEMDDERSTMLEYVDLLLNPERYTGYRGPPAHRIWNSIYQENCFKPETEYGPYIDSRNVGGLCLEKRAFYRAISGLHTSINIHLSVNYLLKADQLGNNKWGPNKQEFLARFSPESTNGEGPQWLKNLYFVYLLELRALAKAAPYLENEAYFTGNEEDDIEMRKAMKDILQVIKSFPNHFDENSMFVGKKRETRKLKNEFKQHFRNISRIMDCVGCDKCKVWGKLQIQGLGTAFKILFSGNQKLDGFSLPLMRRNKFQLQRTEIVSLLNGFGRLSSSIRSLEVFRDLMK